MKNSSQIQISVSGLSYKYSAQNALDALSFEVNEGDYIGLIGPNGGGKTTLVKLLLGLLPTQTGAINFHIKKSEVGYVPQRASQNLNNFPATVSEVILSGSVKKVSSELFDRAVKITKISHLLPKLIGQLSGGELQKVLIARSLIAKPKILVLDEPIVGVDEPSQDKFYKFLKNLNTKNKITIIFVSHDIDVITKQASKVFCLNKKLDIHHNPQDLLSHETIKEIFGEDMHLIHHHH
jgi:zinc transport system ATP-binding protein